ncbi:hypothetical protein ACP_1293 [Acidobacterium capsulatum ATCC 51196]|uniref:Uncharacterized protein n=1 Tax=Acidobacterium capsulatum (strain ATCC 51196 / DSM 11244 / BCRC 80197 / JCM 7670 / NBRC 15755 / NCIMB 13165 / 161) TaxID=240015 RepID=C1F5C1_ACIC5|nr:hypothetical protein ACP_1293 [Acidobacterium capsulatum ATCC 51196]
MPFSGACSTPEQRSPSADIETNTHGCAIYSHAAAGTDAEADVISQYRRPV